MVVIRGVEEGSHGARAGLQAGDELLTIDSHPIRDVLDYRFYLTESHISLCYRRDGQEHTASIRKGRYEDLGLEFESFLMDRKQTCRNKCVFCFIDQNPKGMRESIYFKDDDTRLSFLMGNYVTLTNVSEQELSRICQMKLSPVNVSVHTTNPCLRVKMLGNRFAGKIMDQLRYLAEGGVKLNCQLVLCRGMNDGKELEQTLLDLWSLYPAVESVAAVPAGLTGHRDGLYEIPPYDAESALEVLELVDRFQEKTLEQEGTRFVFCSDEFYLLAHRPIPEDAFYEGYPQLDNGVGTLAMMGEDLRFELEELGPGQAREESVTLFTGEAAYAFLKGAVEAIGIKTGSKARWDTVCVKNRFFGGQVTVAGLLTGADILAACQGLELGERVILPARMLRSEGDLFLDGMSPEELSQSLGRSVEFCETAADLVAALTVRKDG